MSYDSLLRMIFRFNRFVIPTNTRLSKLLHKFCSDHLSWLDRESNLEYILTYLDYGKLRDIMKGEL